MIELCSTELCIADSEKIRIVAQTVPPVGELLKYIHASFPRASLSEKLGVVSWKEDTKTYCVYSNGKVTITQLKDKEEAREKLSELKARLNAIWRDRDNINLTRQKKVLGPLDVYKLLPKTNCGKCGSSTCLAFANAVLSQSKELSMCTGLYGKDLDALSTLLGSAGFEMNIKKDG